MRGRLSKSSIVVFMLSSMLILNIVQAPSLVGTHVLENDDAPVLKRDTRKTAYTPHDPIDIDGDTDFNDTAFAEGWSGNGSAEDPYIIEGLEIDQGGSSSHCISIINTLVNFTIRNCNITGAYTNPGCGIFLDNVVHGRVESNIVYSNQFNIYFTNAHYVIVKNNTCWDGAYSISLLGSSTNNIITDNNNSANRNRAFNLESSSHDNTIINNTANDNGAFGIVLYRVTYNLVVNNSFNGNVDQGVHSNNADHNTLVNNTCNSNGQGIYLFAGSESNEISNNTCNSNRNHGIYFVNAFFNDVFNNTCNENEDYGIFFDQADHADLVNNTCNFNRRGINLDYTDYSIISNNTCNFNDYGILLDYSTVNTISNNTCTTNTQYGIGLFGSASSNVVEWNTFTDNNNGGYDIGTSNTVDYNYWSNYEGVDADQNGIGDTPYPLLGSSGNQDPHPLTILPGFQIGWVDSPSDQVFEVGESIHYDVNASAFSGIDYWTINDTINFNIDSFGVITNSTILSIEEYGLEISVYDIDSNFLSRTFTVSVVSVFPTWVEVPTDQFILVGENFYYDLNATDGKGLDLWWLNDTVNFDIDQSGVVTNATILPLGSFSLEISVNDTDGHILVGGFSVSIVPYFLDDPIYIDGNQNFTDTALAEGWSGDGTVLSPYIIENLRIDRKDEVGHCISIINTEVHFEIRSCYLSGASINPGAGIYLENVVNGLLGENIINENYFGIYIRNSEGTIVANNTCYLNWNGILISDSSDNLITNNNCSYNLNRGISIGQTSEYNTFEWNTCNNNNDGIVIDGAWVRYTTLANNTCSYNTENGIYELSSDLDFIEDNICNNNERGVYIRSVGNGGDVINNTCNYNTYGIYLEVSDSLLVTNNTCYSNDYGIYNDRGFSNDILWNSFSNNVLANGISDSVGSNLFDYNYWSDYTGSDSNGDNIGDTPYFIPGTPGDEDLHPLMFPPGVLFNWLQLPTDQIIQYGEFFRYDLNASSSEGLDYWLVNDTINFSIDQTGVITNATILSAGIFALQVYVNDSSNNILTGVFTVTVIDTPPVWTETPQNQFIRIGEPFYYDIDATDTMGIECWWINDTVNFNIDQTGVVRNNTVLLLDFYALQVNVNDTGGNTISAIFTVSFSLYVPHGPIIIDSDQDFADTALIEGWQGDGSLLSPYIIAHLSIDLEGASGSCISISNTRVYFIIQDCILTGATVSPGAGIYLNNVTNGEIYENICNYDYRGMYLINSSQIVIDDNICSFDSANGIMLTSNSYYIILRNNHCNNTAYGIFVHQSFFCIVEGNNCSNNSNRGISVEHNSDNTVSRNICNNNGGFGLVLYNTHHNNVTDNIFNYNPSQGIHHRASDYNRVINNTCNNNGQGMYIFDGSDDNIVVNNTCSNNNLYGIYIYYSSRNTLNNNTCSYNNQYGIYIYYFSYDNFIVWNAFFNNTVADGYGGWSGTVFDYNYWSDYTGDDIDGNGIGDSPYTLIPWGYQDPHPLMLLPGSPPTWTVPLGDHAIEYGEVFRFDLNATAFGGLDYWWINDTLHFEINQTGIITNATILPLGTYSLLVSVNDTYGTIITAEITISIEDWSPPCWTDFLADKIIQCGVILQFDLNATDVSGLDDWWLNDTMRFSIDAEGLLTMNGILPVGEYGVQVFVNDTLGHVLSYNFTLTVIDTLAPTWVEEPENQVVEYGSHLVYDLNATDPSGIGDWSIDDTVRFTIDSTGRITANFLLTPNTYSLVVYVSDIYGHTMGTLIFIEVADTTPPEWTTEATDQYIDYGVDFEYQLSASDLSGIDYWRLNDTSNFDISSNGWISSRDILEPGQYGLLVTVYDRYGNELSVAFTIFVTMATTFTSTTTTTTTATSTQTTSTTTSPTSTTPPGPDIMIVIIIGIGIGGGAVVIIVIIILRKRGSS
jgi:parallel beta-helix repeat protein